MNVQLAIFAAAHGENPAIALKQWQEAREHLHVENRVSPLFDFH
jgi:hypothetical protein